MNKIESSTAFGGYWDNFEKELCTPEEIEESNLRVALISEMIEARNDKKISQQKLEEISGIKQPVISRLENGTSDPKLSTIIKFLHSVGKTLKVVPIEETKKRA